MQFSSIIEYICPRTYSKLAPIKCFVEGLVQPAVIVPLSWAQGAGTAVLELPSAEGHPPVPLYLHCWAFIISLRSELWSSTRNWRAEISCTVPAPGNYQVHVHKELVQQSSPAWSCFCYYIAPRSCSSFRISFGPSLWGITLICSTEALRSVTITMNCLIIDATERQRCIIAKFCGLAT